MHIFITPRSTFATTLLMAVASGVCTGSAAESTTMLAADCFRPGTATTTSRGQLMNNSHTSWATFYCALVRHNRLEKPVRVEVTVIDNHRTDRFDVRCQMIAVSKNGRFQHGAPSVATEGANRDGQTLSLPIPDVTYPGGGYVITCSIPPREAVSWQPPSSASSIYWQEP